MSTEIVLHVEGLEFRADSPADEPRVLDLVIAERAGLAQPRDVRRVIKNAIADGSFRENEHFRICAPHAQIARGRPSTEYLLTEAGSLKLMTRLRTPAADACVDEMIRVYRLALNELRAPKSAPPRAEIELVNGPRIADDVRMRDRLRKMIMGAAAVTGRSHQAIHGALRNGIRPTSSIYLASQLHYEKLCDDVLDITDGRWLLPAPRHARLAPVVDIRQTRLPFPPRNAS